MNNVNSEDFGISASLGATNRKHRKVETEDMQQSCPDFLTTIVFLVSIWDEQF